MTAKPFTKCALLIACLPLIGVASPRLNDVQAMLAQYDCQQGSEAACLNMAMVKGVAFDTGERLQQVLKAAEADCDKQGGQRCADFAQLLFLSGEKADPRIYQHFANSCDTGDGWACAKLSDLNGFVPLLSSNEYRLFYQQHVQQCAQGDEFACTMKDRLIDVLPPEVSDSKSSSKSDAYCRFYQQQAKQCETGDQTACTTHARLNVMLPQLTANRAIWFDQLNTACTNKSHRACTILSYLYGSDNSAGYGHVEGTPKRDDRRSLLYSLGACQAGNSVGCWNTALAHDYGEGVPMSSKVAHQYYARACAGGYASACEVLNSESYWSKSHPLPQLQRACKLGDFSACLYAVEQEHQPIARPREPGPDTDRMQSYANNLRPVCEMGSHKACGFLAYVLHNTLKETEQAKRYASAGCGASVAVGGCAYSDANSCVVMGSILEFDKSLEDGPQRAAEFYEMACDMGNASGCNDLGILYDTGKGVPKNRAVATEHFLSACALGSAMGCNNLSIALRKTDAEAAREARSRACRLSPSRYCDK